MDERDRVSFRMSTHTPRRRKSLFGLDFNEKIAAIQNKHFPRWAKLSVFATSLFYCILMIITVIVQISDLGEVDELCNPMLSSDQDVLETV